MFPREVRNPRARRLIPLRPGLAFGFVLLAWINAFAEPVGDPSTPPWDLRAEVEQLVVEQDQVSAFSLSVEELESALSTHGPHDRRTLTALATVGRVAHLGGNQGLSADLLRLCTDQQRHHLGQNHADLAWTLVIRGLANRFMWARDEAAQCYEESRQIVDETIAGRAEPTVLEAMLALAEADFARHEGYDIALPRFHSAVELLRRSEASEFALADALTWYGWNIWHSGDREGALPVLREAESILRRIGLNRHTRLATVLELLAEYAVLQGDLTQAEQLYRTGAEIFDTARSGLFPGLSRRLIPPVGRAELALILLELGREEEAWVESQKKNGFLSDEYIALSRWSEWDPETYPRHASARSEYLEASEDWPDTLASTEDWETLHRILDLRARLWALERDYLEKHRPEVPDPVDVASVLGPDAAMMGTVAAWFGGDKRRPRAGIQAWKWNYVLRGDGEVRWERIYRFERDEAVRVVREGAGWLQNALLRASTWQVWIPEDQRIDAATREWSELSLHPLSDHFAGVKHLIGEGASEFLPLEMLNLPDDKKLIELVSISYTPSATAFLMLSESRDTAIPRALVVGSFSDATVDPIEDHRMRDSEFFPVEPHSTDEGARQLAELSHLHDEMRTVLDAIDGDALIGDPETYDKLRSWSQDGRLEQYGLVHMIGHGYIPTDPERMGLILPSSDGRPRVATSDRIVYGWQFDNSLVVLSACRMGRGTGYVWGEFLGRQAFFGAGARGIIASIWPVDDAATYILMKRFYAHLTGTTDDNRVLAPAAALIAAKRWLRSHLDESGVARYAHPVYWAGFRFIGGAGY